MISPYLNRPPRPQHVVIAEIIANMRDTYLLIDMVGGEPYIRETDLGQSFNKLVQDLIDGMWDCTDQAPVAVLRMSRDAPTEDVTENIAREMIRRIDADPELAYDDRGNVIERPFLDNCFPKWRDELQPWPGRLVRDYDDEEAA